MPHDRRFRFGVQLFNAPDAKSWTDTVRRVEDMGFSTLFVPDHFGDQLAPVPALAAAAAATSTLRLGALVWDNDYKHPVVLAKEAATIDLLSNGRLEFGIGAGWMNTDYEQSGIPKDRDGVRIARLSEAIAIYKGLFGGEPFDFEGEHYRITQLTGSPRPVQQPHPPLLIGGGGPKMISLAARHADIVGINPAIPAGFISTDVSGEITPERLDTKLGWLRDAAGDRLADLELNVLVFFTNIGPGAGAQRAGTAKMFSVDESVVEQTPYAWIGETSEIVEKLQAARERWGMSYFVVQGPAALEQVGPVVAALSGT